MAQNCLLLYMNLVLNRLLTLAAALANTCVYGQSIFLDTSACVQGAAWVSGPGLQEEGLLLVFL